MLVVDTKHELDWPGFVVCNDLSKALRETHAIYRPPLPPRQNVYVDRLMQIVYQQGGWDIYFDEIYTIGYGSAQSYPQSYISLLTRGRSRSITVWTGTQRPVFLPRFSFTESRHLFMLELGSLDDQKHVSKMIGSPELADLRLSGHQYAYYRREGKILLVSQLGKDEVL